MARDDHRQPSPETAPSHEAPENWLLAAMAELGLVLIVMSVVA